MNNPLNLIAKGTTDIPDALLEYANIKRSPDVMPVMFKMVHAAKNANMDKFMEEELEMALPSVMDKALNWEHSDEFIGHIKKAYLVKTDGKEVQAVVASNGETFSGSDLLKADEGEPSYILAIGLVYKHRKSLRDKTVKMENRSKAGTLAWSMETFFQKWECDECHQVFADESEECQHMKTRFVNGTGRILRDLTFVGAGVVEDPADKQATNIAIGAENKEEKKMPFKSFETEDELKKFVDESTAGLKASLATLEADLANSKKELDSVKAETESLKKSLVEKETIAKTLEDELAKMRSADKLRIGEARLAELVGAGFVVKPENTVALVKEFSEKSDELWSLFKDTIKASITKPVKTADAATVPAALVGNTAEASVDKDKAAEKSDPLDKLLSRRRSNY